MKTKKSGFILVITLFLLIFLLGLFFINYRMTGSRSARLKSFLESAGEGEDDRMLRKLTIHELESVEANIRNAVCAEAADYFIKTAEGRLLWVDEGGDWRETESNGGYRIKTVLSGTKEIFPGASSLSPGETLTRVLEKGKGGKFTVKTEKIQSLSGENLQRRVCFLFILTVEYANGNENLTEPDGLTIGELEATYDS
ncbi:MAG: hypothetical protein LBQ96_03315 [Fusobacteriaceae bacterium]|jgi:hypothetical protein|nr:hypothetical protein [Fusobacteriaceae bacterium]